MTTSDNLLRRLARVKPTVAFLGALALMVGGLLLPGIVGAALLVLLGAGLVALTRLTWPVQSRATRVIRVALLLALFTVAVVKVL